MRLTSLFITALAALGPLAAPLAGGQGTTSTETSRATLGVSSTRLRERGVARSKATKALTVPTVQQIKAHLRSTPDRALLYSGPGGYINQAEAYIKQEARRKGGLKGLKLLEHSWKDPKYPINFTTYSEEQTAMFWDNASQAFAEMASGTVYVLVSRDTVGTNFYPPTILARIEWPTLLRNPHVTKVVKVYPDSPQQEIIKSVGSAERKHGRS